MGKLKAVVHRKKSPAAGTDLRRMRQRTQSSDGRLATRPEMDRLDLEAARAALAERGESVPLRTFMREVGG
jgi:hypothetical protein